MVKARKVIEVIVATGFVIFITAVGIRVEEPFLGLLGAIIVWLYFKADFSK